MNTSEFVDSFLKTLPTEQVSQEKCYVVGLIGLPGSGKSTFSEALSVKTGLYIASNDKIRRWLNEHGIEDLDANRQLVEQIAESRTLFLLKRGISHIIDADIIKYQNLVRQKTEEYSAKLFIFHISAPDDVILKRLKQRQLHEIGKRANQLSRAGVEDYEARKLIHTGFGRLEQIDLVIDTMKDIDNEVNRASDYLAHDMKAVS